MSRAVPRILAPLVVLGALNGCARATGADVCTRLRPAGAGGTIRSTSPVARLIAAKLGRTPFPHATPSDLQGYDVLQDSDAAVGGHIVQMYALRPRWATDQRPYRIGCLSDSTPLALAGFPVPDGRALLGLADAKATDADATLLAHTLALAHLVDVNGGRQVLLGSNDSVSSPWTTELHRVAGGVEKTAPHVRLGDGVRTAVVTVASFADWAAVPGVDVQRIRVAFDSSGRVRWLERVIVSGEWLMAPAGPDSVRFTRSP